MLEGFEEKINGFLEELSLQFSRRTIKETVTSQIKELDLTLYHLFYYANNRQVQSKVQTFYLTIIQRCYNMLRNGGCNITVSLAMMLIRVILSILAQVSRYHRRIRDNHSGSELAVQVANDSFFSFIKTSFVADDSSARNEQHMTFDSHKIDGLYCYFSLVLIKLRELGEPLDLDLRSLFAYMVATENFDDAVLLVKYFEQFRKQLIYHLLQAYFRTFESNRRKLKSRF